jgi:hypothetical protein
LGECFAVQGHIFWWLEVFLMCIDIVINWCLVEEILDLSWIFIWRLRRKMRPCTWCLMEVFICR